MQGIKTCRNAPAITHLLYVDDLLLACRADKQNVESLFQCFDMYYSWSGQAANLEKSHVFFSKNMRQEVKKTIKDILGIQKLKNRAMYLGNSFILSKQN